MLREINHIGMYVTDLQRAEHIFGDVLGGVEVYRRSRPDGIEIRYLQFGGALLEMLHDARDARRIGLDHVGILTDDMTGDLARLVAAGATVLSPPAPGGPGTTAMAFVTDPAGISIELLDRPREFRRRIPAQAIVSGVSHVSVQVGDIDTALAFYDSGVGMSTRECPRCSGQRQGAVRGFDGRIVRARRDDESSTVDTPYPNEALVIGRVPLDDAPRISALTLQSPDLARTRDALFAAGVALSPRSTTQHMSASTADFAMEFCGARIVFTCEPRPVSPTASGRAVSCYCSVAGSVQEKF